MVRLAPGEEDRGWCPNPADLTCHVLIPYRFQPQEERTGMAGLANE